MNLITYIIVYACTVNVLAFVMMGFDKNRARRQKQRIPEKQLWGVALLGGALGGSLGMRHFRHKTKHAAFKFGFPLLVVLEAIIVGYLVLELYQP
ncbi:Uncharacterized membrane protein YsdA, DUF1294 family [Thalassobacillus cyri]|uniref:Uncharacterized membrane protein YsdA, DUF1294 family n=1 Tax=Thalassobacillus cyri TaxID=571932 RepID=A0A1H4BQZ4_9BACI|nr:DUF1294 domain-containing protein [Thalassobacillus cyri]SEA50500.1 Uncharacterized membrane protein YsdA, DUF1294 family [Thalassobacillus cyri]